MHMVDIDRATMKKHPTSLIATPSKTGNDKNNVKDKIFNDFYSAIIRQYFIQRQKFTELLITIELPVPDEICMYLTVCVTVDADVEKVTQRDTHSSTNRLPYYYKTP